MDNPETFENSASYIASWLSTLNHDTKLVITTAAQAQRACDLINQVERESVKDNKRHPKLCPPGRAMSPTSRRRACTRQSTGRMSGRLEPTVAAIWLAPTRARRARIAVPTMAVGPGPRGRRRH